MDDELSSIKAQKICGLCNSKPSKYSCPRCDLLYCSLDCYKSETHLECSENFYKDCITEELNSNHVDDESKQKMIEILKRMQEQDTENDEDIIEETIDSDDEDEMDLHERIKDLNLDDADALWNALTEDEKNDFEALLNQGDVGGIIPHWEPWWMYRKEGKMVEEVGKKGDALENCPKLIDVPKMSTLTKVEPSPAIKNNITNVLASFAFVMRYFNGDVEPVEWTTYFLHICANLDLNTNFVDPAIAVESVAQKCLQSNLIETDKESLDIMKHDTFLLLQGPCKDNKLYYCKSALSSLHKTLSQAKSISKKPIAPNGKNGSNTKEFSKKFPEQSVEHLHTLDKSKVKKCLKKIEYYLSFLNTYNMEFE